MGDSRKFSGMRVLTIILVVILVLAMLLSATIDGIVETIKNFFKNLAGIIVEGAEALFNNIKIYLGWSVVKNGMYIYPINPGNIEALKSQLEANSIDTEKAGITEVILRKILLTQAVTTSTKDTLCVAEISQEQILKNTGYTDLDDYFDSLTSEKSKDVWPIDDYNYDLYYLTDNFFYFKDEKDMLEKGSDKYYLGVLGEIIIKTDDDDGDGDEDVFRYVSQTEFNKLKEDYQYKQTDTTEYDLLHNYTIDNNGQMIIYKRVENINTYSYKFNNSGSGEKIEKLDIGESNSTYDVISVPMDIQSDINTERYAVSTELLINLLNISSSSQYLDEFMDYAIEKTRVTLKGYSIENEEKSYEKETFNIEDKFIYELYDMVNGGDIGKDNMKTYKPLIYDRVRKDGSSFSGSVVNLSDFESIDYNEVPEGISKIEKGIYKVTGKTLISLIEEFIGEDRTAEGVKKAVDTAATTINSTVAQIYDGFSITETEKEYIVKLLTDPDSVISVYPINKYLILAYDPGTDFSLGSIEVEQIIENQRIETSWVFCVSSISTWYGNIAYDDPIINNFYYIDCAGTANTGASSTEISATEYYDFDKDNLTEYEDVSGAEFLNTIIYSGRATEAGIIASENTTIVESADIFNNVIGDAENKDKDSNYNFKKWTLRGLGLVSSKDKGKYNTITGPGSGSDYLYTKYKTANVKKYPKVTKYNMQTVEQSTNLPKVDLRKVDKFLSYWKNESGIIGDTTYDSNGKKVQYNDIYKGKVCVGDMFESAPEMTFELLASSESTKGIVDIFKYIMHRYTGTDYGITDESQIAFVFDISPYGGSDYTVNTPMSDSKLVLTKEQLEEAIKGSYKGDAQKNLLSCVDDFIYIQDNNKVNAVFAVAVTIIESSGGTNWAAIDPSTYNWYSIKGSYNGNSQNGWRAYSSFNEATRDFGDLIANGAYYFKAGKYTVKAIAPTYCNEEWGNSVVSEMTKIYNSIGISGATGGTEGKTGNYTTFTANGRTYINYKQKEEAYKSIKLATYDTTLFKAGCGITSDAIIGSGFGSNKDPIAVNNLGSRDHLGILRTLTGKTWSVYKFNKDEVLNELKKGNPVIVRVEGDGGYFKSEGHFTTILSISEDGNSIYISDPAFKTDSKNGWMKTSILNASGYVRFTKLAN